MFDVLEKAIENSRDLGASYVEARGESGFIEYIQMDDSRINALTQRIERGVAIRALVDGAWGFVTTGDIDNLDKAVSDAISMAKAAAPSRHEPIELADVKTHEEVINFDKAKSIGLNVVSHNEYATEWKVLREWLAKYMLQSTDKHVIRFTISEKIKKQE